MVYLLFLLGFEPFVEGLFRYPKALIEPLCFKRFFFFNAISFATILGIYFFDKSTSVMVSISAIISC
jgi:hypothetical protein